MRALALALALASGLASLAAPRHESPEVGGAAPLRQEGCVACHEGIEPMHPEAGLSCTDCHGGDADGRTKLEAHVAAPRGVDTDERVPPLDRDLDWRRFRNPMDLRVAPLTCGGCHARELERLHTSLHGTTAGHLSDGYYEMGLVEERESPYAVFPVSGEPGEGGGPGRLVQVPPFADHLPEDELATHFTDLARKECMQCHLWSSGRAVRGRVGFDGDYRGAGCAACHVAYELDGLSRSADRSAVRTEPGHPARHEMTRAPSTQTCTSCHYGDASIGLAFRGLSQLPPGAPGGPEIPGTTDVLLNRAFYLDDPALCPPDVHHERGMHCVDCHTMNDVMGDGLLHGKMEHAVEITCVACHGGFAQPSSLRTERGTPLAHLRREGERVVLTSKVTGAEHEVPQVVHVLDPERPEYNAEAARAMTPAHADVECYTCHAGWNVNFLGFHFDRNASLSQLDLLTGGRTPGRVTTQEKVFATWKSFYAGFNERGAVAPYMTGFSTMGSVTDEAGERVLEQVMPVTAEGLSGVTMIHHQTHTVRPTARQCVECHRAPSTWGLGSVNFQLGRQLAFVADRRGVEVVALDRGQLSASVPLAKLVVPEPVALALRCDPLQGFATHLYVAEAERGLHAVDLADPTHPQRTAFRSSVSPRGLALAGEHLYLADGVGGLVIFDVSDPARPRQLSRTPTFEARDVAVAWPYAYVADGPGGLAIYDVRAPMAPRLLAAVGLGADAGAGATDAARAVELLFQYSRPVAGEGGEVLDERAPARHLAAVLDEREGLVLIDVTEPTRPRAIEALRRTGRTRPNVVDRYVGLALASHVDPAELQGGRRTTERDYAYVLVERTQREDALRSRLLAIDLTDPERPRQASATPVGQGSAALALGAFYNPPFLQRVLLAAGSEGALLTDLSLSAAPAALGALPWLSDVRALELERFPLDRMLDASGRPLKDVSHAGSRWLNRAEIERVLGVSAGALGLAPAGEPPPAPVGATARLLFAELDADRSGFLEGEEARGALAQAADADADGLVTLLEVGVYGGELRDERTRAEPAPAREGLDPRVTLDGDLAQLLDGLDPRAYDKDRDGRLDRAEMQRALFAALDLDGDGGLDRAELSRHPGALRRLRYDGPGAERLFAEQEGGRDGRIVQRELRLRDEDWRVLDADGDGGVALPPLSSGRDSRLGRTRTQPEWPRRRGEPLPLPPGLLRSTLEALLDADGDGELSARELRRRKDLLVALDRDGSGSASERELGEAVDRIARAGVDAVEDRFEARWDLDGDGEVQPAELPLPPATWRRLFPRR